MPRSTNENFISAFLNAFQYLDGNGHRNSSFLSLSFLWRYQNLTAVLESEAGALIRDLESSIKEPADLPLSEKVSAFLNRIKTTVENNKENRTRYACMHSYDFLDTSDGSRHTGNYQDPHKPGKFEKNLIAGLEAAMNALSSSEEDGKDEQVGKVFKVINEIKGFTPERFYTNTRVYS